ncbi:MAG: hypothetical protein JWL75_360 [Parcubacteria group bacterium]|nr:hypothetical protein [Parcubacteria group bacterium]
MYTLNLSEVKLNPALPEDKSFENENQFDLEDEVVAYISGHYGAGHSNPVTIRRHVQSAIRDTTGMNIDDRVKSKMDTLDAELAKGLAERKEQEHTLDAEYGPKFNELLEWKKSESDKIYEEYEPKIMGTSGDERATLEEEKQLKIDDVRNEYNQKDEALSKELSEKRRALR